MKKTLLFLAAVITAMLLTAYQTCGDIDFRMIAGFTALGLGGPLLALTTLVGFYRTRERGWHAWQPAGWVFAIIMTILATVELSKRVLWWEEERAQRYPAQVEAELEQFRQTNGRYPGTLADLSPQSPAPRLIQYSGDQDDYAFGMEERGLIWGTWHYDRSSKKWTYND